MSGRLPRVFLSSPLKGLENFRQRARDLIRNLGFEVFAFEHDGSSQSTAPLFSIHDELKRSDVIVAFLGSFYGTSIDTEPISFTEEEIYKAFSFGKEIKLYVLEPTGSPRANSRMANQVRQGELSLLPFRDIHIGISHTSSRDGGELLGRMSKDLINWRQKRQRSKRHVNGLHLGHVIRNWQYTSKGYQRNALSTILSPHSELANGIDEFIEQLQEAHSMHEYANVWQIGSELLGAFKNVRIDLPHRNARQALERLASILSIVENAASFLGQLDANEGALSLAKALVQVYSCLGDWRRYASAANELSSIYYMRGDGVSALNWNDLAKARLPKNIDLSRARIGILSVRSSILRHSMVKCRCRRKGKKRCECKNRAEIEKSLNEALELSMQYPEQHGLILSQAGSWALERGEERNARVLLEQTLVLLGDNPPLWVRAAREWGRYLKSYRDDKEFSDIEKKALTLCDRHSLEHQKQRWREAFPKNEF